MPTEEALQEKSKETGIPRTILRSDAHAQHLWKKAHDSAVKTYGDGGRAHRVAYAALKHEYQKQGDHWVKKAEKGPSDPQAARGPTPHPKSTQKPGASTAHGKVTRAKLPQGELRAYKRISGPGGALSRCLRMRAYPSILSLRHCDYCLPVRSRQT